MKKDFFISLTFVTTLIMSLGLSSCSSDDDPKYPDVTINAGETKELTEGKDLEWKSENEYIATVSNGQIYAGKVGKVKMVSEDGSFSVNVTPKYTYFEEPYLKFGTSIGSVKKAMKGYNIMAEENEELLYYGKGEEYRSIIRYHFEDSKLKYTYIYTSSSHAKQLVDWANERYIYITTEDDYIEMISVDQKNLIIITPAKLNDTWLYAIGYAEIDNSSNAKSFNFGNTTAQKSNNPEYQKVFNDMINYAPISFRLQ